MANRRNHSRPQNRLWFAVKPPKVISKRRRNRADALRCDRGFLDPRENDAGGTGIRGKTDAKRSHASGK